MLCTLGGMSTYSENETTMHSLYSNVV
jgi:hypothetical protein